MSEPFIAQTVMFGGNFAPRSWALCDGQLLAISSNSALFSILGTTYGGDGRTTFGLPGLRGRSPVHAGRGPGLSNYSRGQRGGSETTTLTANNLPSHNHRINGLAAPGTEIVPTGGYLAGDNSNQDRIYVPGSTTPNTQMASDAMTHTGGGQSFSNVEPHLAINFIIALYGIYPSRN